MRGALVYVNDLEGKITKINLSNNTKGYDNGVLTSGITELYDQTTLFRLDATKEMEDIHILVWMQVLDLTMELFICLVPLVTFTDLGNRVMDLIISYMV
ncbi:MAG: hypothetical protein CM15mP122_5690 [Bacteroidota bacterium]|nr:MAG: hypothetical protein CM15mP122_5690 [Bacteroidota bacterium]